MNQRIAETSSMMVQLIEQFSRNQGEELQLLASRTAAVFAGGGQLLIAGHGIFQPLAQLLASHFTFQLGFARPVLPAVALGSDPILTAAMAGSDQAEHRLVRHYRALGQQKQLLILLSDGTNSPALRLLRDEVLEDGHPVALLTTDRKEDPLAGEGVKICLSLGTNSVPRLLEMSLFAIDLLCELVEVELFGI